MTINITRIKHSHIEEYMEKKTLRIVEALLSQILEEIDKGRTACIRPLILSLKESMLVLEIIKKL